MGASERRSRTPMNLSLQLPASQLKLLLFAQAVFLAGLLVTGLALGVEAPPAWLLTILVVGISAAALATAVGVAMLRHHRLPAADDGLAGLMAMHEAVINGADSAILVFDERGRVELGNPALQKLTGLDDASLSCRQVASLFEAVEAAEALESLLAQAVRDGAAAGELALRRQSGEAFPLLATLRYLGRRSDDLGRFVLIGVDLRARLDAERLKNEFVSMVSHELRTPLTSIHGAIELIRESDDQATVASVRPLAEIASSSSSRLINLINDLLDLDRVDSDSLQLDVSVVSLGDAVRQAAESAQLYFEQLGIGLDLHVSEEPITAEVDIERLIQVLLNLLSNAAKFGAEADRVQLRLFRRNGQALIEVEDHGEGIPEALKPRLFDRFVQGATTGRRKGSGLGLAISKALVERMGGQLSFSSAPGCGSCFRVELPIRELATKALPETGPIRRLLLCDANPERAATIAAAAEGEGVVIVHAGSVGAAEQHIAEGDLDAAVVDADLPGGNLVRLLRSIRNRLGRNFPLYLQGHDAALDSRVTNFVTRAVTWLETPEDEAALLKSLIERGRGKGDQRRILHIEDDAQCQELVRAILSKRGSVEVEVEGAASLAEAREKLTQKRYHAVLLDRVLPDGDGNELLPLIARAQPQAVCVGLSAYAGGLDASGFAAQVLDKGAPYAQSLQRLLLPSNTRNADQSLKETSG